MALTHAPDACESVRRSQAWTRRTRSQKASARVDQTPRADAKELKSSRCPKGQRKRRKPARFHSSSPRTLKLGPARGDTLASNEGVAAGPKPAPAPAAASASASLARRCPPCSPSGTDAKIAMRTIVRTAPRTCAIHANLWISRSGEHARARLRTPFRRARNRLGAGRASTRTPATTLRSRAARRSRSDPTVRRAHSP